MTRHHHDRGSVLMLMPAAVLIVILLGSIAVDFAVVFLAQRELGTAASAAANDAATYGLDEAKFRAGEGYQFRQDQVATAVRAVLESRGLCGDDVVTTVRVQGLTVYVSMSRSVDYIFAKAIPGVDHSTAVAATERARAAGGTGPGSTLSSFGVSC
jgi:Flp pilus assembly protein TadG